MHIIALRMVVDAKLHQNVPNPLYVPIFSHKSGIQFICIRKMPYQVASRQEVAHAQFFPLSHYIFLPSP
jgi:hypothetical protein